MLFAGSVALAALAGRAGAQPLDLAAAAGPPARSFGLGLDRAFVPAATFRPASASVFAGVTDSPPTGGRHFWLAAGELALTELLPWVYDRYIENDDFSHISWHTVSENWKAGWGYDSDHFNINQSAHPYQGSFFFEAGRSNGYNYWESGLFALSGSLIWEYCFENTRPSLNDLVNTTLGGMSRGEVQHRLSIMLLDNTASGGERLWREIGAALLNPVGAVTRLVNGDVSRSYPNPDDRLPDSFSLSADLGYRQVEGPVSDEHQGLVSASALYGDPFTADVVQPFDSFSASIDLTFPADNVISRFEERGILRSWELTDRSAPVRHVFGFSQEYEYINNEAEVFGAQMFSAGVLSRWTLGGRFVAATDLEALVVPLAGVKTTNFENPETGRNYDYGPGGGALASLHVYFGERQVVSVGYGVIWQHTLDGSSVNNTLQFFRATGVVPIAGPVGVGGGFWWYSRKTSYPMGHFEPRQTQSEWRLFVRLAVGASGLRVPKS